MAIQAWLPVLALAILHIAAHSSTAAPTTAAAPEALPGPASEFLEAHNLARAEVGVGPLNWSRNLANLTDRLVRFQRNQKGCGFADLSKSQYGGNQMWASGGALRPRAAVEAWVKEKEFYNRTSNTCVGDHRCGVYTQVVWRKSTELGCAQTTCRNEGITLTICFYYPPGNVVGEAPF